MISSGNGGAGGLHTIAGGEKIRTMKKIVFTGGGTAGHVTPNLALIEKLDRSCWDIHYIGTRDSIEEELTRDAGVTFHAVSSGKLRRYLSLKNVTDAFRVLKGIGEARRVIRALRPDVLFSKGGYVSVPVVMAAKGKCPVIAHESDYSPGLANRIAARYADTVCVSFSDTLKDIRGGKGVFTGTPVRSALYRGDRARALSFTGLTGNKPVLLCMGGSLGAATVNDCIRRALPQLLPAFDVVHLCGRGKVDDSIRMDGYLQYDYIKDELPDLFALADVVLSRAGANAVFELLALQKPAVLVPLTRGSTRGDQILNAEYFERNGYARYLSQEELTCQTLTDAVNAVYRDRASYQARMAAAPHTDGTDAILALIFRAVNV